MKKSLAQILMRMHDLSALHNFKAWISDRGVEVRFDYFENGWNTHSQIIEDDELEEYGIV
jgi:hypothetical protein